MVYHYKHFTITLASV